MNVMIKLIITLLLFVSLALLCVCDGTPVDPNETTEGYYLSGAIIKNLDLDRLSIRASLTRNDTILTTAVLRIGDDTLTYDSGYYFKIFN